MAPVPGFAPLARRPVSRQPDAERQAGYRWRALFLRFRTWRTLAQKCLGPRTRPKDHGVLDGDACTLAQEWRHRMGGIAKHRNPLFAVLLQRFAVTQAPFEQRPRKNRADELQSGRIKIAIEICEFLHGCGNSPSLLLPTRLTTDPNHIHDGSMTQRIMEKIPIGADEHGKGRVFNAVRHIGHRHKCTKCHLARIVHGFVTEETSTYLRGVAVTSDQYIAFKRLSVGEPCHDLLRILG